MLDGGCGCGAVRFETPDQPVHASICYCRDCRRQSGAPLLAWAMFSRAEVTVKGAPSVFRSSEDGERAFCATCGTGLFFSNATLRNMGMIQVRIAALDDPEAVAPTIQVQTAERPRWLEGLHELPAFARFPG